MNNIQFVVFLFISNYSAQSSLHMYGSDLLLKRRLANTETDFLNWKRLIWKLWWLCQLHNVSITDPLSFRFSTRLNCSYVVLNVYTNRPICKNSTTERKLHNLNGSFFSSASFHEPKLWIFFGFYSLFSNIKLPS